MNGFRITFAAGVAAAMALVSMPAHADEQSGFSLGLRLGYAVPLGAARSGLTLASLEGGMVPFRADVGYRINPNLFLGGYFQYGLTFPPVGTGCIDGGSCSGDDLTGGIAARYHFRPAEFADPWVGLGVGYEVARVFDAAGAGIDNSSQVYKGFQFDLSAGLDLHISKSVPFGPFVDFAMGRFAHASDRDVNGSSRDEPITSEFHEWLTFGGRAQFNL